MPVCQQLFIDRVRERNRVMQTYGRSLVILWLGAWLSNTGSILIFIPSWYKEQKTFSQAGKIASTSISTKANQQ